MFPVSLACLQAEAKNVLEIPTLFGAPERRAVTQALKDLLDGPIASGLSI
jgi:hypothetical protein